MHSFEPVISGGVASARARAVDGFGGLTLATAPGRVMTPRPATEALVERAVELAGDAPLRVVDVGTGSGAIAVALAARAARAEIWATDTSAAAVWLARLNAARLSVAGRVHILHGDLLEPVPGELDLVLANLPYLPEAEAGDPDLARARPDAVVAPGDGLGPYRRLLTQCDTRLAPGGIVVIQFRRRVLEADRNGLGLLRDRLAA
ncbi:MAG: methyltransferase [Gaiellaceae bacterium]